MRLETDKATQIVLRKTVMARAGRHLGDAKVLVDGKWLTLNKSSRMNVGQGKTQAARLRVLKPLRDQVAYSEEPTSLEFVWAWDGGRQTQLVIVLSSSFPVSRPLTKFTSRRSFKVKRVRRLRLVKVSRCSIA